MIALLLRLLGVTLPTTAQLDAIDAHMDSLS